MYTILIVDDDRIPMNYYEHALQKRNFLVERCYDAGKVLELLNNRPKPFDLLVLDVMMPPGKTFTMEETEEGVITGVRLHERIRRLFPDIPIIILTNSQNPDLYRRFEPFPQTRVLRKKDYPPFTLAAEIGAMLSQQS